MIDGGTHCKVTVECHLKQSDMNDSASNVDISDVMSIVDVCALMCAENN